MRPPELVVVVAGTRTGVGKTWVAARVAAALRERGVRVAARKPAQSFDPEDPAPTDAEVLAAATGEAPERVCPPRFSYPLAAAPPMAAAALGRAAPELAELLDALCWPEATQIGLVEGVGGVASPLAADGDTASLADAVGAQLTVVVAKPDLGAISDTRLAVRALRTPVIVVLNGFDPHDPMHVANQDWLADRDRFVVVTSAGELAGHLAERVCPLRKGALP